MTSKKEWKEESISLEILEKMGEIALFCSKLSFLLSEWEFVTDSLKQQRNEILHRVEVKMQETNAKKEAMEIQMKEWIALEKRVDSLQEEEKNLSFGIEVLQRKVSRLEKKKIDLEMFLEELQKELAIAPSFSPQEPFEEMEEEESYEDIYEEDED